MEALEKHQAEPETDRTHLISKHKSSDNLASSGATQARRKGIRFIQEWPDVLQIKIATTEAELEQAYSILHDSYTEAGIMTPHPSGLRVLPQHLMPQTTTVIALWNNEIIGTVSAIRDNAMGLPIESSYCLAEKRSGGRRVCEISSLALKPAFRGRPQKVLFPLFRFITQYAKHCCGVHEQVIGVHPNMAELYKSLMLFTQLTDEVKNYDFVCGAPVTALTLNLENWYERLHAEFADLPLERNNYQFFTSCPPHPGNRMPSRSFPHCSDPVMTPKLLNQFFLVRAGMSGQLSDDQIRVLHDLYPYAGFAKELRRIRPHLASVAPKELLFDTSIDVRIGEFGIKGEVLQASEKRMLIKSDARLQKGSRIKLVLRPFDQVELQLEADVGVSEDKSIQMHITSSSPVWNLILAKLELPLLRRAVESA